MIKKCIKILFNIFFIICLYINFILILCSICKPNDVPDFAGFKPFVVKNGSNQTDVSFGDFVISRKTNKLKENDVVVVKIGKRTATTFTIKKIDGENLKLENDSNTYINLSKNSIEGKMILDIKNLGKAILFIRGEKYGN